MNALENRLRQALALPWDVSFDGDLDYKSPQIPVRAKAAVLILVNQFGTDASITLTKRTEDLRMHSGQVAFPGGRIDPTDADAYAAARREAFEEIGLPLDHPLKRLGVLSHHHTITGFDVAPFVVLNETRFEETPEEGEVAEIFQIDFDRLKPENFEIGSQDWKGQERRYFVLPHNKYFIWGATARMLHQLASRLEHVQ